jgi:hypothetical protein
MKAVYLLNTVLMLLCGLAHGGLFTLRNNISDSKDPPDTGLIVSFLGFMAFGALFAALSFFTREKLRYSILLLFSQVLVLGGTTGFLINFEKSAPYFFRAESWMLMCGAVLGSYSVYRSIEKTTVL